VLDEIFAQILNCIRFSRKFCRSESTKINWKSKCYV